MQPLKLNGATGVHWAPAYSWYSGAPRRAPGQNPWRRMQTR